MQFLLQHTGAPSTNNGSAFALTSCTLYHIPFDMLMKIIHECPVRAMFGPRFRYTFTPSQNLSPKSTAPDSQSLKSIGCSGSTLFGN